MISYFQHFIQVCFYLLGKKVGGGHGPPWPLPLLRHCVSCREKNSLTKNKLINKKKLLLKTHRRLSLKIWRRNCPGMRNVHFRFPSVDQKRGVCSLRQIQRIFWSEIQQIWKRKTGKRVCSIGNLANTFKMATSKQLLLERAQRFQDFPCWTTIEVMSEMVSLQ